MPVVAAIPAAGLLAGAALGLLLPDIHLFLPSAALLTLTAAAMRGWRKGGTVFVAPSVALAFFAGGVTLTIDAWRDASRPPLRSTYDALARADRVEAAARGSPRPNDESVQVVLTGLLLADATPRPNGVSLSVKVSAVRATGPRGRADGDRAAAAPIGDVHGAAGRVQLTVAGGLAAARVGEWRAGRTVRLPAQLRRPARYLNPGLPDQERALARRGTTLVGTVKSGALVEVVALGHPAAEAAASARAFVRRAVSASVGRWSARSAAIVTAIVIGDRAGLDESVRTRLQEAGTYHVIAISGGNIAILAGLTLALFRVAGLLGPAAMLTAIVGLIAYQWLVGGGASVERATLMAVVFFAGRTIDLRGPPLNALMLVAVMLVIADPLSVADPAFLLTFGATAGILLAVPAVGALRPRRSAFPFATMLAASVGVEAALLPVAAGVFSRVTFAGLILNFAAIPLMAITQVAGMALVPAGTVSPTAAAALGWVAHVGAEGLVRSADLVKVMPALTWRVAPPHWAVVSAYYVALAVAWALWRWSPDQPWCELVGRRHGVATASGEARNVKRVRRAAAGVAAAAAAWMLVEPGRLFAVSGDGLLRVTFIDVGQGDAAAIQLPGGERLLVDAGGAPGAASFDMGDRVVAPVLRHLGVRRLDTLAVTHGDADHVGGVGAIVRDFRPREIWEGVPVPPFEPLRVLRETAGAAGVRWTNVQCGDSTWFGGVQMTVRHPPPADWERQDVRNDDSIVIELLWRDVSIVLAGDIGSEVEAAIAPLFPPVPLRVLKVPHHGSLTSSSPAFVEALRPSVAVVSAGRNNPFGHPAPAVLERYFRVGAEVFRTDRDGAVMLETDGYSLQVRSYTNRTLSLP
jgi:competence protein ComEC